MSRFISGSELNHEITKLITESYGSLIFISPYIKLHERLKYELKNKMNKEEIELIIVFGKNENDLSKSLSPLDTPHCPYDRYDLPLPTKPPTRHS